MNWGLNRNLGIAVVPQIEVLPGSKGVLGRWRELEKPDTLGVGVHQVKRSMASF